MDRNNKFLKFIFTSVALIALVHCIGGNEKEAIFALPDYGPTLNEAIGKYYFVPKKDEFYNRDDYKYLNLKKGDTLFLEIKKDSTYFFNKFYFNQGELKNNLSGKIKVGKNSFGLSPNLEIKNANIYMLGFKKSKETGLYYYYGINSPTDGTEFEYYILYKKMK
ncbi:hypothetical protein [Frigoriflavimonas asaccharolytica]|uniref:Uncharacterized protein n=1 Tax=Frigoriflavimonas asaccharolytica TaxID=2735899 RepID=A0A8J8G9Q8_9FLAO|nr:hypothetical protein [Frigoriflavimonas asaccharolytica]NRS93911.1 hypothetical protein [Frigoriflavimonas asaccharolytica]